MNFPTGIERAIAANKREHAARGVQSFHATAATPPPAGLTLTTLRAVSNGALKSTSLPSRIKVLDWGTNETAKGRIILDDSSAAALAANQAAAGFARVALDFEHNTVPGSPEYERTKEPREIAGYGTPVIIPGDGLYLENVTYTASGAAGAKNFEDLSPAVKLDEQGRVVFLHSVALVRNGAVHGLTFFSASRPLPPPRELTGIARAIAAHRGECSQRRGADASREASRPIAGYSALPPRQLTGIERAVAAHRADTAGRVPVPKLAQVLGVKCHKAGVPCAATAGDVASVLTHAGNPKTAEDVLTLAAQAGDRVPRL